MINWFASKKVREASAMCKHVHKLLQHQRDIMAPNAIAEIEAAMAGVKEAIDSKADNATLDKKTEELEKAAEQWIKPYPNAAWRENVEVLLVALAVAMAIRTFFLQPFKIPTASMEPTLYGIELTNLVGEKNFQRPTGLGRVKEWFAGTSYLTYTAQEDGTFEGISRPLRLLIFNIKQTLWFNGKPHNFWFVPDTGGGMPLQFNLIQTIQAAFVNLPAAPLDPRQMSDLELHMGLPRGTQFHRGEDVLKMKVIAGDHLFIDRVSYNFVPPSRGDIVVFQTKGIPEEKRFEFGIPDDEFYIKRLVGLGGETISLKQDYMVTGVPSRGGPSSIPVGRLVINGQPLSTSTPHFENLYAFSGTPVGTTSIPFKGPDFYYGHAMLEYLADGNEFHIRPGHLFVMGDDTMNSLDSRYWGDFPQAQVIGKSFFVYWPINARFGLSYH